MAAMRIAFVAYHGSIHTRRWAAFFAAAGHDVHVVTCGDTPEPVTAAYTVHDVGAPRMGKLGYVLRIRPARVLLRRLRPDLVHAHWLTSYGLIALASGVRPLVATAHGDDLLIAPRSPLYRWIVRRVLRASSLVTVPSPQMSDIAATLAGDACPIEVLQYGVETARLTAFAEHARGARPLPPDARTIVSARPLLRLYRFDVLLDALALGSPSPAWRCDLYGDGPERRSLEQQAARLGLGSQVVFHGRQPSEVVEGALAGARLYVSVAESDGASIALLETLALGPVPVLSDIPSNRYWVEDGVNGVLTGVDPSEVAVALDRALALDAPTVRRENARIVSERGDRDRNLTALERMLVALVESA